MHALLALFQRQPVLLLLLAHLLQSPPPLGLHLLAVLLRSTLRLQQLLQLLLLLRLSPLARQAMALFTLAKLGSVWNKNSSVQWKFKRRGRDIHIDTAKLTETPFDTTLSAICEWYSCITNS